MRRAVFLVAVLAVVAGGCASSGDTDTTTSAAGEAATTEATGATTTSTVEAPSTTTTTTTTQPEPAAVAATAENVLLALIGLGAPVTDYVVYTAETDPNELLGRPGGYSGKATFTDSRTADRSTERFDIANGGSVEVFASESEAVRRADYIRSVLDANPILGTEYDFISGRVLLRLSPGLTPDEAAEYEDWLVAALQSLSEGVMPSQPTEASASPTETGPLTTEGLKDFIRTETADADFIIGIQAEDLERALLLPSLVLNPLSSWGGEDSRLVLTEWAYAAVLGGNAICEATDRGLSRVEAIQAGIDAHPMGVEVGAEERHEGDGVVVYLAMTGAAHDLCPELLPDWDPEILSDSEVANEELLNLWAEANGQPRPFP